MLYRLYELEKKHYRKLVSTTCQPRTPLFSKFSPKFSRHRFSISEQLIRLPVIPQGILFFWEVRITQAVPIIETLYPPCCEIRSYRGCRESILFVLVGGMARTTIIYFCPSDGLLGKHGSRRQMSIIP